MLAALFFAPLALAYPASLAARSACTPNFQGTSVHLTSSSVAGPQSLFWTVSTPVQAGSVVNADSAAAGAQFRFEQTGSPNALFNLKVVTASNGLGVKASNDGLVADNLPTDIFKLTCTDCAAPGNNYPSGQLIANCWIQDTTVGQAIYQVGAFLKLGTFDDSGHYYFAVSAA